MVGVSQFIDYTFLLVKEQWNRNNIQRRNEAKFKWLNSNEEENRKEYVRKIM